MPFSDVMPAEPVTSGSLLAELRRRVADFVFPEGREQRDLLARAANTDTLTGLASRRAFELAERAAELDAETSFVVFDCNNFKIVNDAAGHLAGDSMLREVARCLVSAAHAFGIAARVFRIGGDEFVILAPVADATAVRDEAERLFGVRKVAGHYVSLSGTCGASFWQADNALADRKAEAKGLSGNVRL